MAFKLAQALLGAVPQPSGADAGFLDGLLKLVAIGTVADMMPLVVKTPCWCAGAWPRWRAGTARAWRRC